MPGVSQFLRGAVSGAEALGTMGICASRPDIIVAVLHGSRRGPTLPIRGNRHARSSLSVRPIAAAACCAVSSAKNSGVLLTAAGLAAFLGGREDRTPDRPRSLLQDPVMAAGRA
jgi:hypothetical protein